MKKPSDAQVRLLAAIQRERIVYWQATGAYNARYMNVMNRETIAKPRIDALVQHGWVTGTPTQAQRMGGPIQLTLRLTAEGREVLDGETR
jgi:hypothetical protein